MTTLRSDLPGQSGSDRDPRMGRALLRDTSRLLTAHPTPSRLCQFLVFHASWNSRPWSAAIARCSDDGVLHLIGTYGIGHELVDSYQSMPLHQGAPLVEAVTTGRPVIYVGSGELEQKHPEVVRDLRLDHGFREDMTLIDVPLTSYAGPIGSLGIFFDGTDNVVDDLIAPMEDVAALLAVYLEATPSSLHIEARTPAENSGRPTVTVEHSAPPSPLTKRQHQVLTLMAQRKTNHEIALALGYSEATIRLDATSIYRELGVAGRIEAVAAAREQGFLA